MAQVYFFQKDPSNSELNRRALIDSSVSISAQILLLQLQYIHHQSVW